MGTFTQAVRRGTAAKHPSLGRLDPHPTTLVEAEYVGSPYCERCGTDEFIYLETFVPATHHRDGSINKLGKSRTSAPVVTISPRTRCPPHGFRPAGISAEAAGDELPQAPSSQRQRAPKDNEPGGHHWRVAARLVCVSP
ncbi:hypothetical protein PJ267_15665 [Arthrobacter sp. OVS8]|nr:hypothetical protein PJ267_15665 [Arthrobacter sp. OVS8]